MLSDLLVKGDLLLPTSGHTHDPIWLVQGNVQFLEEAQVLLDVLLLGGNERLKVHERAGVCLAVVGCRGQDILKVKTRVKVRLRVWQKVKVLK